MKLKFMQIAKKVGYVEDWHDLYGQKLLNIPYYTNDTIINSFKKGGINFNEEIGNINNGNDYSKNERNYYDIYMPYSSLKRKNKYNGIILFYSWRRMGKRCKRSHEIFMFQIRKIWLYNRNYELYTFD